jgi:putative flippase GtrA
MITKIKNLYTKHKEVVLYLFFGGLTTLVSGIARFGAHALFVAISPDFLGKTTVPDSIVSWICAVTFAFFVNKIFVFENKSSEKSEWFKQAAQFYGARLATLGLELGAFYAFVDVLGYNYYVMWVIIQVFIVVGNYFISKFWVFKKSSEKTSKEKK